MGILIKVQFLLQGKCVPEAHVPPAEQVEPHPAAPRIPVGCGQKCAFDLPVTVPSSDVTLSWSAPVYHCSKVRNKAPGDEHKYDYQGVARAALSPSNKAQRKTIVTEIHDSILHLREDSFI